MADDPRMPIIKVARRVRELTEKQEMILSGDPRITVIADRLCPPWLTDVAFHRPRSLSTSELIENCEKFSVRVVVLAYWLWGQAEFRNYVTEYYAFDSSTLSLQI